MRHLVTTASCAWRENKKEKEFLFFLLFFSSEHWGEVSWYTKWSNTTQRKKITERVKMYFFFAMIKNGFNEIEEITIHLNLFTTASRIQNVRMYVEKCLRNFHKNRNNSGFTLIPFSTKVNAFVQINKK